MNQRQFATAEVNLHGQHRYLKDIYEPPAPIVAISVINEFTKREQEVSALLDTGADYSLIPEHIVAKLGLYACGFSPAGVTDFSGTQHDPVPVYEVKVKLDSFSFKHIRAAQSQLGMFVLGRDILNRLKLVFNGKKDSFSIEMP